MEGKKGLQVYLKPEPALKRVEAVEPQPDPIETPPAILSSWMSNPLGDPVNVSAKPSAPPITGKLPRLPRKPKSSAKSRSLSDLTQAFYPDEYVLRRVEGEVLLRLFLDGHGRIQSVRVEMPSPHPLFNEAAQMAVMVGMRRVDGVSGPELLLPVRFRL